MRKRTFKCFKKKIRGTSSPCVFLEFKHQIVTYLSSPLLGRNLLSSVPVFGYGQLLVLIIFPVDWFFK